MIHCPRNCFKMTLGNQTVADFVCSSLQTIQFLLTLMVVIVKANLGSKRPDLGNVIQPHCLCLCFLFCHLKLRVLRLNLTLETYLQIGQMHWKNILQFWVIQLYLYYCKGICFQWSYYLYDLCESLCCMIGVDIEWNTNWTSDTRHFILIICCHGLCLKAKHQNQFSKPFQSEKTA